MLHVTAMANHLTFDWLRALVISAANLSWLNPGVAPPNRPTIPRLELTAGVLSVKVSNSLQSELDIHISDEYFWTDSQVVLAYINNETTRFHTFVSNRVKFIRENSPTDHWMYVPSKINPADDATRGLKFNDSTKELA